MQPVPEAPLPPEETLRLARQLLHDDRPFAAHEVFEVRWKTCPPDERDLWQGLAQLCVALTHHARGNSVGAQRLLDRAAGRLSTYDGANSPAYGLDLPGVLDCARRRTAQSP